MADDGGWVAGGCSEVPRREGAMAVVDEPHPRKGDANGRDRPAAPANAREAEAPTTAPTAAGGGVRAPASRKRTTSPDHARLFKGLKRVVSTSREAHGDLSLDRFRHHRAFNLPVLTAHPTVVHARFPTHDTTHSHTNPRTLSSASVKSSARSARARRASCTWSRTRSRMAVEGTR